jgi:two-component system copper resistance phosphate regulon response regulator CusR
MRLLVIEDNRDIVAGLQRGLKGRYVVDAALSGEEGLYLAEINHYDLIMLDLSLPDMDGLEVCRGLRDNKIMSPILVLTARMDVQDKIVTLDAGADDYMTKPFHLAELTARIRALMRRGLEPLPNALVAGELEVDVARRSVRRSGREVTLRRKEFDVLEYLMRNQGRPVTREMILEHVWGGEDAIWTNAVDVHVKYLRDKVDRPFATKLIKTVHGVGYKIEAFPASEHEVSQVVGKEVEA